MSNSFVATVSAWAAQSEKRLAATHRRSIELLADEMRETKPNGGRLPFQTGNLVRSLMASTQGMPQGAEGAAVFLKDQDVGAVTATLELGQPVWIGYQAIYARRQNYGFVGADSLGRVYNQAGSYFVEGAIANWQQIVAKAVAELQSGVEAKSK
ncbi:hypothetical protein CLH39_11870 [Alcaligenes faecalis]|uniref:hypothetical protein n=1 Tax=Alcaligenes faecalis TaxID=511 RepID=UPI00193327F1|nr:hypothetical protein [Alcaligenes faecalis]QRF90886.1 hypothetical protein CLH39_11870 [Alcaligenes faecalis]